MGRIFLLLFQETVFLSIQGSKCIYFHFNGLLIRATPTCWGSKSRSRSRSGRFRISRKSGKVNVTFSSKKHGESLAGQKTFLKDLSRSFGASNLNHKGGFWSLRFFPLVISLITPTKSGNRTVTGVSNREVEKCTWVVLIPLPPWIGSHGPTTRSKRKGPRESRGVEDSAM